MIGPADGPSRSGRPIGDQVKKGAKKHGATAAGGGAENRGRLLAIYRREITVGRQFQKVNRGDGGVPRRGRSSAGVSSGVHHLRWRRAGPGLLPPGICGLKPTKVNGRRRSNFDPLRGRSRLTVDPPGLDFSPFLDEGAAAADQVREEVVEKPPLRWRGAERTRRP